MRSLVALVLAALVLAGCTGPAPPGSGLSNPLGNDDGELDEGEQYYVLYASLEPPTTNFSLWKAEWTRLGGKLINPVPRMEGAGYGWALEQGCGRFVPQEDVAVWHHGEDTDCSHDGPKHAGTVVLSLTRLDPAVSETGAGRCEYDRGSEGGTGLFCWMTGG